MAWIARAGDRRDGLRFEIVGTLAGSLTASTAVPIRDIGLGGALIEAPWALPTHSVHRVRIESEAHVATCEARVRHVRPANAGQGTYLIGFEFLHTDPQMLEEIGRFISLDLSTTP